MKFLSGQDSGAMRSGPHCSVDGLQQSRPAGRASVALSPQARTQRERELELELRRFGSLSHHHSCTTALLGLCHSSTREVSKPSIVEYA
ncbi:hypothetical protein EYF80_043622 [Liparis tanakae]|uniref:Uncharacterized protein n=1 Tax=Liparis tanakae TaxID=230148 RepID=A0A4Z2FZX7_9TELE|nr:hypothetical protein EYF80_043622 [Liparis tanakae]